MADDARNGGAAPGATGAADPPLPIGLGEDELIMNLERDQLVLETLRPVPRAVLSRRALLGLWALRVFSILVSAMVIYTFIARL
jgi:hypothetical protein